MFAKNTYGAIDCSCLSASWIELRPENVFLASFALASATYTTYSVGDTGPAVRPVVMEPPWSDLGECDSMMRNRCLRGTPVEEFRC